MRCLWITRQDPRPADSGELIYSRGLLRALAAQPDFELTVLAHRAARPAAETGPEVTWELHGWIPQGRIRGMFSTLPSDAWRLGNRGMRTALKGLLHGTHWDWIVVDQAACGWVLRRLPKGIRTRVAYIAHNHEATVRKQVASERGASPLMRLALKWDSSKYARLEQAVCRRADLISAITPHDQELFKREFPGREVICLPPGYEGPMVETPPPITKETPRKVVLAGAFEWLAKRRNLETFLAAADRRFRADNLRFTVAGKADPAYFAALAKRYSWASFHANVPSIDLYLKDARIGLIPEALGGGFKLKALDYIFRGLPLAALTPALSGLPLDRESDVISADNPAALADAVAARIDDLPFLNAATARSLALCREAFRWSDRGALLGETLDKISYRTP